MPHRVNHLTELIIPPPEPGKLVQSKAWLDESVVLNRIKARSLGSTPQLFSTFKASLDAQTLSDGPKVVLSGHLSSAQKKKKAQALRMVKSHSQHLDLMICSSRVQDECHKLCPREPQTGRPHRFCAPPTPPPPSLLLHDVDTIPQMRAEQSVFISVVPFSFCKFE